MKPPILADLACRDLHAPGKPPDGFPMGFQNGGRFLGAQHASVVFHYLFRSHPNTPPVGGLFGQAPSTNTPLPKECKKGSLTHPRGALPGTLLNRLIFPSNSPSLRTYELQENRNQLSSASSMVAVEKEEAVLPEKGEIPIISLKLEKGRITSRLFTDKRCSLCDKGKETTACNLSDDG